MAESSTAATGFRRTAGSENAHMQYATRATAVAPAMISSSALGLYESSTRLRRSRRPSVRCSSAYRLAAATNTAELVTTSRNQRDSVTGAATPPATARSTNPPATATMSNTIRCRHTSVYDSVSAAYPTADERQQRPDRGTQQEPGEQQRHAETRREPGVELARRDRSEALARMATILLRVADVVDRVDPRREQAERRARHDHAPGSVVVAERPGRRLPPRSPTRS